MEEKKTYLDVVNELQGKLDTYKRCKTELSKEDRQGKYKKAYQKLQQEIISLFEELKPHAGISGKVRPEYVSIYVETWESKYLPMCTDLLYKEYDAWKCFISMCDYSCECLDAIEELEAL